MSRSTDCRGGGWTTAAVLVLLSVGVGTSPASAELAPLDIARQFNEGMNRCMATRCSNIEEVLSLFTDDAGYGDDEGTVRGKAAIRTRLLRPYDGGVRDQIQGIDLMDTVVVLRLERRREFKAGKYSGAEVRPHVQLLVLRGDKLERLISVLAPVRPESGKK